MSLGLGAYGTIQTHAAPLRIRFHIPASSRTQAKCTDQKGKYIFKLATLEMIVCKNESAGAVRSWVLPSCSDIAGKTLTKGAGGQDWKFTSL